VRPFRFAVQSSLAPSMKEWRHRARQVEELGYECLYVADHFGDQYGPLVAMTVAAEATTTLRVGSLVFDNDYRHPVVLAKEIATLDLAAEGRVEFGLGAGWLKSDYDESGLPYDPPAERVERMAEALAIMKALWADGKASVSGKHYTVADARCVPGPHSRPWPRIVVGGGSKRVLSIAAREADVVGVNPSLRAGAIGPEVTAEIGAERFDERIGWVRTAAGERWEAIDIQILTFLVQVVPNRAEVLEQSAPLFGVTPEAAGEIPLALVGTVAEICEQLEARRERYGFNYVVVHDTALETFAPVVERLAEK